MDTSTHSHYNDYSIVKHSMGCDTSKMSLGKNGGSVSEMMPVSITASCCCCDPVVDYVGHKGAYIDDADSPTGCDDRDREPTPVLEPEHELQTVGSRVSLNSVADLVMWCESGHTSIRTEVATLSSSQSATRGR